MKSFFDLREAVRSADKKPETYIGPDGKPKIRMVPVDRTVIKTEQAEDDMPASPDEKSMAMKQAKFIEYVADEIEEYLEKNKSFPEWMQNKLSALHEKAKDMHAVLAGEYDDDEDEMNEEKDSRLKSAGVEGFNKPKRTPSHPKSSHIVVAKEGDKVKTIRFGQQGVSGSPAKEGESDREKARRKSFKARHASNIAKGKMSAAYWADKVKW
jgi:hypothetical protein